MTIPYRGTYTAPDGWWCEWETGCPMCPQENGCRHDCGHPAKFVVYDAQGERQYTVSGKLLERDVERWIDDFKQSIGISR